SWLYVTMFTLMRGGRGVIGLAPSGTVRDRVSGGAPSRLAEAADGPGDQVGVGGGQVRADRQAEALPGEALGDRQALPPPPALPVGAAPGGADPAAGTRVRTRPR